MALTTDRWQIFIFKWCNRQMTADCMATKEKAIPRNRSELCYRYVTGTRCFLNDNWKIARKSNWNGLKQTGTHGCKNKPSYRNTLVTLVTRFLDCFFTCNPVISAHLSSCRHWSSSYSTRQLPLALNRIFCVSTCRASSSSCTVMTSYVSNTNTVVYTIYWMIDC